jgi:hypothetical protein
MQLLRSGMNALFGISGQGFSGALFRLGLSSSCTLSPFASTRFPHKGVLGRFLPSSGTRRGLFESPASYPVARFSPPTRAFSGWMDKALPRQ